MLFGIKQKSVWSIELREITMTAKSNMLKDFKGLLQAQDTI